MAHPLRTKRISSGVMSAMTAASGSSAVAGLRAPQYGRPEGRQHEAAMCAGGTVCVDVWEGDGDGSEDGSDDGSECKAGEGNVV